MNVIVVVNHVRELGPRQTTSMLMASLNRAGHAVTVADVNGWALAGDRDGISIATTATPLPSILDSPEKVAAWSAETQIEPERMELQPGDLILIRTNPGRDLQRSAQHETFLDICRVAQYSGIAVLNDPAPLRLLSSKAALGLLPPDCRPEMWVSHDALSIADFVKSADRPCVVKPLVGSRGADVIRVEPDQPGLVNFLTDTFGHRGMVAQTFVDANRPGDQRILVCAGKILESNGHIGGIARLPAPGDFRGNLHAGGTAEPASLDAIQRETVETAAGLLARHGIWLAGVDLVGHQVIEFNVFSTGGLFDASRFAGHSFSDQVVATLEGWLGER